MFRSNPTARPLGPRGSRGAFSFPRRQRKTRTGSVDGRASVATFPSHNRGPEGASPTNTPVPPGADRGALTLHVMQLLQMVRSLTSRGRPTVEATRTGSAHVGGAFCKALDMIAVWGLALPEPLTGQRARIVRV